MFLLKSLYRYRYFILHLLCCSTQRKHIFRWLKSLQPDYLLDHPSPWFIFDAIEFLKPRLREGMRIFEYGSGGSTLFWLRYGALCVSVDHDPDWYSVVRQRLTPEQERLIDYRLVLPELVKDSGWQGDPADPEGYASLDESFYGYSFHKYVTQIDAFPNEYFDFILIDGRARPSCIKHSVHKVKVGGMLIVDDSARPHYFVNTRSYLSDFTEQEFLGVTPATAIMSSTTIFTRRG
jgi:hypothetical protein